MRYQVAALQLERMRARKVQALLDDATMCVSASVPPGCGNPSESDDSTSSVVGEYTSQLHLLEEGCDQLRRRESALLESIVEIFEECRELSSELACIATSTTSESVAVESACRRSDSDNDDQPAGSICTCPSPL